MLTSEYFKDYDTYMTQIKKLDQASEDGNLEELKKIVYDLDIRVLR